MSRKMRSPWSWPAALAPVLLGLLLTLPALAACPMKIVTRHRRAMPHGVTETRLVIRLIGCVKRGSRPFTERVEVQVSGPTHSEYGPMPQVFTNADASLMAIQSMPHWARGGHSQTDRSIYLIVSTPGRGLKVIRDFSERANRLCLNNVSRWQNVNGHFYRPASDITVRIITGRIVRADQPSFNPRAGLREYISLGVKVTPSGRLIFDDYFSQGF